MVDIESAVIELSEAVLPDARFGTFMPSGGLKNLPLNIVRRVPSGASGTDYRFADRALVDVQSWGNTRESAYDGSWAIFGAIMNAWDMQTTTTDGVNFSWVEITAYPSELRDELQYDNTWRFQATYSIVCRSKE